MICYATLKYDFMQPVTIPRYNELESKITVCFLIIIIMKPAKSHLILKTNKKNSAQTQLKRVNLKLPLKFQSH